MPSKKEIEALAAEYSRTRDARLKLDEQSAKMKVREDSILDSLTAAQVASGVYGKVNIQVKTKKVARVTDWPGFHAYILANNALDMLERRPTQSAVMARLEADEYVPGVVTDEKTSYKFTVA